ncbi:probable LRR receptor-like serine/threonine-protein kinase At1g14390 isoform X2 [Impatiens glandulifera]|uniref:probable LRR receptor-like serine/threonine-protein kinase At1g14390 isoform X2 n=1 Tax=Impatiens glandulifera TaxID=253017 RepID=UPI001FB0ACBB|nr:probable LRR receptor-like serine/threonine-protein kinase At1g14390 isoform X2 [Impatiens glandulifera]
MEIFHHSNSTHFCFCFWVSLTFFFFFPFSSAQLSPSETRILIQIQHILEYPQPLQSWSNSTNFCNLPPTQSLTILCSGSHITELTIIGNKTTTQKPLSNNFSIYSFFTIITKLSNLRSLKLVGLGMWGPLPSMISRLKSIEMLDISSNFFTGEIPDSIGSLISIRRLVLSDNLFNGSVPHLNHLKLLEDLHLGKNHLGPNFPLLPFNLVNVSLRNNSIRSAIPNDIKNFSLLRMFDLSSNKLLGSIPYFLLSLPSIQNLNLADNRLSGSLPLNMSCSSNLTYLDISKNLLIGKLPICFREGKNRTVLSSWNCFSGGGLKKQHPYSYCNKQALAVEVPVEVKKRQSNIKIWAVVGIIGGGVGIAIVFMGLVVLILRVLKRKRANHVTKSDNVVIEKGHGHVPRTMRLASLLPPYNVFTLEEMEDATNNFDPSNLVGELGLQGQIYKGWLRDGSRVLVRCLKIKEKLSPQSLQQQMEVISKLRHRNLVSVLGHCIATYQNQNPINTATTIFIVMEYMANGSLRDHLSEWAKRDTLKWPQRMGLTMGVAKGVEFLHSGISPGIFGNGLRIENILLDETLSPKLSSYKIPLSSSSKLQTRNENGEKEDIYQLGSILLQLITGKVIESKRELDILKIEIESSLVESSTRLREVIDPSIRGSFAYESIKTAVEISLKCVCEDENGRPNIEDFLWHMKYSLQVQQGWTTSSGNLSTMIN